MTLLADPGQGWPHDPQIYPQSIDVSTETHRHLFVSIIIIYLSVFSIYLIHVIFFTSFLWVYSFVSIAGTGLNIIFRAVTDREYDLNSFIL